jgi:hypothetical protein
MKLDMILVKLGTETCASNTFAQRAKIDRAEAEQILK